MQRHKKAHLIFIYFFIKSLTVHLLLLDYCALHGPFQPYVFLLLEKMFFFESIFLFVGHLRDFSKVVVHSMYLTFQKLEFGMR